MPLMNFVNNVFNIILRFGTTLDTISCYVCLWGLILGSILFIYKNIKRDISILFVGLVVAWFISYGFLAGTEKPEMFFTTWRDIATNPLYILFIYAFFGYVVTRYITDYVLFTKVLARFSIAVVMCSTLSFFMTLGNDYQAEYMTFSYNMTMHSIFLFLYYFEKKNPAHLLIGILGFVMILMAGCRGATVCIGGCMLLYVLFGRMNISRKIILISVLAIVSVIVFAYFYELLDYLAAVAEKLHINSRTLQKIQEGEFLNDSGRGKIQAHVIEKLDIFGRGLYGDRVLTSRGGYAHNLFLELLCHYGYFLGGALCVTVLVYVIHGLFSVNNRIRFLVIVMMSTGFFKLFLSGSYLNQEPALYVLLGLCVNSVTERKKMR